MAAVARLVSSSKKSERAFGRGQMLLQQSHFAKVMSSILVRGTVA